MSGNEKLYGFFFVCSTLSLLFGEKPGDDCGHAVLGPESGVISSKNYPGTYPNNTRCQVKIRLAGGSGVVLKFADLDIEAKQCDSDHVVVLQGAYGGDPVFGPSCGNLKTQPRDTVLVDSNEITVQFQSGVHISGRGFLLSYATRDHKDLLTCLDKGSHFSSSKYTKYCPAGCKAVAGDVSGDVAQGYRHTSVLCKAAVHAGVILDEVGGAVTVEEHKGRSHYAAARANGIQSKDGSLSDTLFTFVTDDLKKQTTLRPVSVNASSWCPRFAEAWCSRDWSPNGTLPDTGGRTWAPEHNDRKQWLQLDLGEKKKITGIITTGSTLLEFDYYVRSYKIEYKERNRWKTYTQNNSSDYMVFEGNVDSLHTVRNTFHPPIVARFLRVVPYAWNQKIALRVELLGCPYVRANLSSQIIPLETVRPKSSRPREDEQTTQPVTSQADIVQLAIIIASTVVGVLLVVVGICVFKSLQKKKTKETPYGATDAQETAGCWKQIQPFSRHQSTEFTISYSSEKDPVQKLDLVTSTMAEYQQPLMIGTGTVARKGSTFRPMDMEAKDEAAADPAAAHYDYLHTANQYALPLTNQEPEYATPIIERHTFRKEGFLPDPCYSVPGAVLSKTPSFKAVDCGPPRKAGAFYQTPQVKTDRANNSEGVYDCPKASAPPAQNGTAGDYQRPQAKPSVMESYSSPRDCVKAGGAVTPNPGV
ncbi:hypothetical protein ANANG_G00117140 [Anguilla anguilla]|uniref:Uncharacterized protein n=1 Tax=Anguilla anguilla TaxID=7936 RepID=A0A9D3MG60_ANGAN|nr:hypothetical protein ANANG_G00117140 [Anguilla anguilla]